MFPFPVCQRANTVSVGSVPRSVPLGTPRKPLQGLAVPQFHDFRRIGGENTEKTIRAHPGEKDSRTFRPTSPVCASTGAEDHGIRSRGRARLESPRRASCAVEDGRSTVGNGRRGQKEEKHRFFSRIPADFRRIYFKAGISAAVTSARNSGPRGEKPLCSAGLAARANRLIRKRQGLGLRSCLFEQKRRFVWSEKNRISRFI